MEVTVERLNDKKKSKNPCNPVKFVVKREINYI